MTRILLIPCGKTFWTEQGRLSGAADMPLSRQGFQDAQECARKLSAAGVPQVIYTGRGQAEKETLAVMAKSLNVKTKVLEGLEEPDMGLWEGLTAQDLQQRSPKAYKQLSEQPSKVIPPSGEPLEEAIGRLVKCIDRVCEKHKTGTVGLVVGPLAEFLLESWMQGPRFEEHWVGRERPEIVVVGAGSTIIPDAEHRGLQSL
jgi:broad specificity phosphatase PhoE